MLEIVLKQKIQYIIKQQKRVLDIENWNFYVNLITTEYKINISKWKSNIVPHSMMCNKCPSYGSNECNWLEKNFVSCLKEKSVKDELPKRACKVENVIGFK